MARRRNVTLVRDRSAELLEIEDWYREMLARTPPPPPSRWEPVKIGPSWQWSESDGWALPERSLGWNWLAWAGLWLTNSKARKPWCYTPEQARFLLWFGALDEGLNPEYHSAVLQRLKGWGKDPLAAALSLTFAFGPTIVEGEKDGRILATDHPDGWVQIAAVSQEQTKNTMKLMPGLLSRETRSYFGIQVGKTSVWGLGDTRQIEAVTSSPLAIEGGRPNLLVLSETQNWVESNGGHDMVGAMDGNAVKSEDAFPARRLDICNAYRPGEDSVGQRRREGWEKTQGPNATHVEFGLLYDSIEAPPEAPLTQAAVRELIPMIRGDSEWLSPERVLKSVTDPSNPPSESRRKWFNQIDGEEDAWALTRDWDKMMDAEAAVDRRDEVALTFDAAKSDDATVLVLTRILDGHVFHARMWQRPPGRRGDDWIVPVDDVDAEVDQIFENYNVVAFFADPSHALDDETDESLWVPVLDRWHRRYSRKLRLWAKPGKDGHSVMFDMTDSRNAKKFAEFSRIVGKQIQQREGFTHDGDPRVRKHVQNARRMPTKYGISIGKAHRESRKKVDLAVAVTMGQMVRRDYLNRKPKRGGWAA